MTEKLIEVMARGDYDSNGYYYIITQAHYNETTAALQSAGYAVADVVIKRPNEHGAGWHINNLLSRVEAVLAGATPEAMTELSYAYNAFDRTMIEATK